MKGPITIIIEHIDNGAIDVFLSACEEDKENDLIVLPNQMRVSFDLLNEVRRNPDFYRDFED